MSILCMTYNHEKYIQDALEGFLAQDVNFKFEVIVHDDASTDSTSEIIRKYEKLYPEIIHGIYERENQYSRTVQLSYEIIQDVCQGKYVAICEGDDYWIDIHKLQIQVDYLEQHPDYVLTVHDAVITNLKNGEIKAMSPFKNDGRLSPERLIIQEHGILPTASMVFKRESVRISVDDIWVKAGNVGDYPLQLLLLTKGNIYYLSRIMSVYRYMHDGSWSKKTESNLKEFIIHTVQMIDFLRKYDKYTQGQYQDSIRKRVERFERSILSTYQQQLSLKKFLKILESYDRDSQFSCHIGFSDVKDYFLQVFKSDDLGKELEKFCKKYSCIYVMGAGKLANLMAIQMDLLHLEFDGFIVSDGHRKKKKFREKPILELQDISHCLEKVGIVLGINIEKWNDVIEILDSKGIKNYLVSSMLRGFIELERVNVT